MRMILIWIKYAPRVRLDSFRGRNAAQITCELLVILDDAAEATGIASGADDVVPQYSSGAAVPDLCMLGKSSRRRSRPSGLRSPPRRRQGGMVLPCGGWQRLRPLPRSSCEFAMGSGEMSEAEFTASCKSSLIVSRINTIGRSTISAWTGGTCRGCCLRAGRLDELRMHPTPVAAGSLPV
jgi:hypothetical protein